MISKMLNAKKNLNDTRTDSDNRFYERPRASLDAQIDELVYELYEITPDERAIIEKA